MKTLKYGLMIAGATLAAFAVALVGAYLTLPELAPGVVTDASSDSLTASGPDTTVTKTAALEEAGSSEEPGRTDTAASGASSSATAADTALAPSDSSTQAAAGATLRDSLQALQDRLRQAKDEVDSLREEAKILRTEADSLRTQLSDARATQIKVDELSNALLDMERRELTALLKDVDMNALEQLYQQASGRSRTRLLQAMAPARAARFVNKVVENEKSDETSSSSQAASQSAPSSRE